MFKYLDSIVIIAALINDLKKNKKRLDFIKNFTNNENETNNDENEINNNENNSSQNDDDPNQNTLIKTCNAIGTFSKKVASKINQISKSIDCGNNINNDNYQNYNNQQDNNVEYVNTQEYLDRINKCNDESNLI